MIKNETQHSDFSVKQAIRLAKNGAIEDWVHKFLQGPGNNVPLSEGLQLQRREWSGPSKIALSTLISTCGPGLRFHEDQANWEIRIDQIAEAILNGIEMPPLIAEYVEGDLFLRDGNHRCSGLLQAGISEYWVIIWYNSREDFEVYQNKVNPPV